MSGISNRYARALFETGVSEGSGMNLRYGELLNGFSKCLTDSPGTRRHLLSPVLSKQKKRSLLASVFSSSDDLHFLNFLELLIDKNRMNIIDQISDDYSRLVLRSQDTVVAVIESAFPLDDAMIEKLKKAFMKKTGAREIRATVRILPELVGGVRVIIGSKIYDGTTRSELDRLYESMRK